MSLSLFDLSLSMVCESSPSSMMTCPFCLWGWYVCWDRVVFKDRQNTLGDLCASVRVCMCVHVCVCVRESSSGTDRMLWRDPLRVSPLFMYIQFFPRDVVVAQCAHTHWRPVPGANFLRRWHFLHGQRTVTFRGQVVNRSPAQLQRPRTKTLQTVLNACRAMYSSTL